jgi:hypothetical protein
VACADRTLEACDDDVDCAVSRAFPWDASGGCFENEPVPLACIDADLSCPPTTNAALDLDGGCFLFGNCLPGGFTYAPEGSICSSSAPFCGAE